MLPTFWSFFFFFLSFWVEMLPWWLILKMQWVLITFKWSIYHLFANIAKKKKNQAWGRFAFPVSLWFWRALSDNCPPALAVTATVRVTLVSSDYGKERQDRQGYVMSLAFEQLSGQPLFKPKSTTPSGVAEMRIGRRKRHKVYPWLVLCKCVRLHFLRK